MWKSRGAVCVTERHRTTRDYIVAIPLPNKLARYAIYPAGFTHSCWGILRM